MKRRLYDYTLWNLFLLTVGAGFVTFAVQNVAAPHGFLTGGVMGVSLLCTYIFGNFITATTWNLLFNIPLMLFSWFNVSRAFVIYTTYGTFAMSAWGIVLDGMTVPIQDPLYACILSGVLYSVGCAQAAVWTLLPLTSTKNGAYSLAVSPLCLTALSLWRQLSALPRI